MASPTPGPPLRSGSARFFWKIQIENSGQGFRRDANAIVENGHGQRRLSP
jgi:hypothetical protein